MSIKKITMEHRQAQDLLEVLWFEPKQDQRLIDMIRDAQANARGDYDLGLDDYEVTLKMKISDVRDCAEILARHGYDTTLLGYLFADVIERHEMTPARRRAVELFRTKVIRDGRPLRIGNGSDNSIHWRHAHWLIETKQAAVMSSPGWDGEVMHLIRPEDRKKLDRFGRRKY